MIERLINIELTSDSTRREILRRGGLHNEAETGDDFYQHLFSNAIETFAHLTRLTIQRYYAGTGRSLQFGIIRNPTIGAFALSGDSETDFIGVHFGSISLVSSIFTRLLSNPNILPDIGNAIIENNSGGYFYIPATEDLSNFPPCRPACAVRSFFARHLSLTALAFIFAHEITHITNGHLALKKISKNSPTELRPELSIMETQALELDADMGATHSVVEYTQFIRYFRFVHHVEGDDAHGISWRNFYENESDTLRYCFMASYVALRMNSPEYWDRHAQESSPQPMPPFRMGILMQAYVTDAMDILGESRDQAETRVIDWCKISEQALADLLEESGRGQADPRAIISFFLNAGNHGENVAAAYRDLADQLGRFAMLRTMI